MLAYWTHDCRAPCQTEAWCNQMRGQMRPNAFLRLIENRWVSSESSFVDMAWWDACTDPKMHPLLTEPTLPVWVGVDASVERDSTAIVACTFDTAASKIRLIWYRTFQPSPDDPLYFEATIEQSLLDLRRRFYIRETLFTDINLSPSRNG